MTTPEALPYAGEDRRRMLARLAEDDFLPPREPRKPDESPEESPSPPERALRSAANRSPRSNLVWQPILQKAIRDRRARILNFCLNWSWAPLVGFHLVIVIIVGVTEPKKLLSPARNALRPSNLYDELGYLDEFKSANRKMKKSFGPGKAPPPNFPVPHEEWSARHGMSKAGLKELRDDWFAPNPVDDEQP